MQIEIVRPQKEDLREIERLFRTVIIDTFIMNKIPEAYEGEIHDLVTRNTANVEKDIKSANSNEYYLIARDRQRIVGIMGFGIPSKDIKKNYTINLDGIPEIKNAYVLPEYQKQGIGTKLFEHLKKILQERGYKEFILDSGFTSAQVYWKKKLGEPVVVVKNYWGDGTDYIIWHTQL
jgi:ribosomal protein S18 acetylase RimI-like enzyme